MSILYGWYDVDGDKYKYLLKTLSSTAVLYIPVPSLTFDVTYSNNSVNKEPYYVDNSMYENKR